MKTIHRYYLPKLNMNILSLPEGAEILDIQMKNGDVCLWAMEDSSNVCVSRYIEVFPTGEQIPENTRKYITTIQITSNGVYHFFERLT